MANFSELLKEKGPIIFIIIITVLLFLFVILYLTYAMKSSSLRSKVFNPTPIQVEKIQDSTKAAENAKMPAPSVGLEYTYSVWLYLNEYTKTSSHKTVLYRGDSINNANPIIILDKDSNRLHVILKTKNSNKVYKDNQLDFLFTFNRFLQDTTAMADTSNINEHIIMSIDYIPLHRWVQISVVVDNKNISLYIDGEIYAVRSTDEFTIEEIDPVTANRTKRNVMIDSSTGDLYIGKGIVGAFTSFLGWIGKVEYYNYAATIDEIRKSYSKGPVSSTWLSMFGITKYGIRAPIYKLAT
jgi:hypothetical protein